MDRIFGDAASSRVSVGERLSRPQENTTSREVREGREGLEH